jgi:hypothetical protein
MCYFFNTLDIGGSHNLFGYLPIYVQFGTPFPNLFAFPESLATVTVLRPSIAVQALATTGHD